MEPFNKTMTHANLSDGFVFPVTIWQAETSDTPPIVFLHSLFFSGDMFDAPATQLAKKHTCFAPTFRGQAGVPMAGKWPDVEQLAADIIAWLKATQIGPVHLVGSSMGAYVVMEILRHSKECAVSVTLSCCTSEAETNPERFVALAEFIANGPHENTGSHLAGIMFGADTCAAPTRLVKDWISRFEQTPPEMANVVTAMFAHPDYQDVLASYHGPALLIAGALDRAKSPKDMHRMAVLLPQAIQHVFAGTGHTPAVEDPAGFARVVRDFVRSVDHINGLSKIQTSSGSQQGTYHGV